MEIYLYYICIVLLDVCSTFSSEAQGGFVELSILSLLQQTSSEVGWADSEQLAQSLSEFPWLTADLGFPNPNLTL